MKYHMLDSNHNVVETDFETWLEWNQACDERRVRLDNVHGFRVSTVFLTVEHDGDFFETMVFHGEDNADLQCERYETWEDALNGHERILKQLQELSHRTHLRELWTEYMDA